MDELSPEVLKQLMELGVLGGESDILTEEMLAATALRDAPGAQGRQAGRVFVAANPLEHLSSALRQYRGGKQVGDVRERQRGVLDRQAAGREAYGKALLDLLRRGQPGTGPGTAVATPLPPSVPPSTPLPLPTP